MDGKQSCGGPTPGQVPLHHKAPPSLWQQHQPPDLIWDTTAPAPQVLCAQPPSISGPPGLVGLSTSRSTLNPYKCADPRHHRANCPSPVRLDALWPTQACCPGGRPEPHCHSQASMPLPASACFPLAPPLPHPVAWHSRLPARNPFPLTLTLFSSHQNGHPPPSSQQTRGPITSKNLGPKEGK